ncbi:MAG TPA: CoA transferase [Dehalococcoidia bacterium]|nr:CoA transferase [Dehalococcoidia bacterium]
MTGQAEHEGALDSLTILDLSEGVAGPYAAHLFAVYGAQVIKVERPGAGDASRHWAPYAGEPGIERSLTFAATNAGKLGLTLDYETPEGAAILGRLAEDADGIIEDHPTRRRDDLGLGFDALVARIPRLVIVQVSGYGATGPYSNRPMAGLTLAAAAGVLPPDAEGPTYDRGLEQILGMNAYVAALAGLLRAAQTEHGQVVDVGGMPALASLGSGPPPGGASLEIDVPRLRARHLLRTVDHADAGTLEYPVAPFEMSLTPPDALTPAPLLGEHTDYILTDLIEMEAAADEALRAKGVV